MFKNENINFIKVLEISLLRVLRYRVHVSLIYFFLVCSAWEKYSDLPINYTVVLAFVIWHFALYLFDRAYDAEKDVLSQHEEAIPVSQKQFLIVICVTLSLVPIIILYGAKLNVQAYLPFLPFAFLYTYPILPYNKRFKDVFLVKNLYSAFIIWSFSIFGILKYYAGLDEISIDFYFLNFSGLLVLTVIGEIHWDMRDIMSDKQNKVYTMPIVLGLNLTKIILISLLTVSFFALHIISTFSFLMMIVLVALAGLGISNVFYHMPPIIALYNFIVKN